MPHIGAEKFGLSAELAQFSLFYDLIAIESSRPAFVRSSLGSVDARKERQINDSVGEIDG
jgi:hypothetical protein